MKICYVITRADEVGGAQVHVRDLAELAQKDGHSVLVIVGEEGLFEKQLRDLNIEVKIVDSLQRKISPIKDILALYELYKAFKQFDPDVITLHSSKAGIVGRLAAILSNHNTIFTAHGWSFADGIEGKKKKFYIMIERYFSRYTKKIITVSEQDKKLAIAHNVSCQDKQVVIHNGIKTLDREIRINDSSDSVSLIMVARFSEQKDHETLLKALGNIRELNWNLRLVGKGKLEEQYKSLVNQLGINHKVAFLGQRDDVDMLLANSDVFLLISHWEGYPLSILEAMRAGLPIVASDVGGNNESVKQDINGYLIERKDVAGLTNALKIMINDKQLRNKIGAHNLVEFKEKHTVEKMYNKTLSVYQECARTCN
ncbi:glycosyltransferase family 4 protein [Vibrio alginolyticus]|uniref:glycosyltransferase family 4 protein n=1 Tax=Vibrio alginolyticus TaxID=663 RepID=UPI001BD21164|nr:glycosyltransferase family 4 protein [Vibrio alginolyticus]EJL8713190.1 glycosyltransferase family 4 protein [Vibrio alginolyticus]ELA9241911.1 glycosyltransferase family 4 protein [Vibrio alginolyticus]ELN6905660.1 glycosyltransferase family 4 protein [Vibrio alginolyticus]MBT0070610.1 glycosyltransferase family 4 protein [Vibrio alginolyticus]MCG6322526.1 glycosyltransferase family 4 protein [Vibrio alginolyticus]